MPATKYHAPVTKFVGSFRPRLSSTLSMNLVLGTPIFPGQTIVFRWESDWLGFNPPNLGAAASISLQLVDDFGNLDPNGVLYKSSLSNNDLQSGNRPVQSGTR